MAQPDFYVVIPARLDSSRLKNKVLLDIAGKPMLQRVYEQACQSDALQVVIATESETIKSVAQAFGATVVMTAASHPSGTDRIEEAVRKLGWDSGSLVVNVQGDEPLIDPGNINQVAENLMQNTQAAMATLSEPVRCVEDIFNPNIVKVVTDLEGFALYFSRAPIPWNRACYPNTGQTKLDLSQVQRHIGIYAYRVAFLQAYVNWEGSALEQIEQLEQLRALEHGVKIHVQQARKKSYCGVDTEEDLVSVREYFAGLI